MVLPDGNIYTTKVNGIIPWAGIQRPAHWPKNDPNPGCAFVVKEDGTYELTRGYYYYKQITRAGQPGMSVAETYAMNSEISVIGFASNDNSSSNAFIVTNISSQPKKIEVAVNGARGNDFEAFRTSATQEGELIDAYRPLGIYQMVNNKLVFEARFTLYALRSML